MTFSEAGRKGGFATLNKYGREQMREWGCKGREYGHLGGSNPTPTLEERKRQVALSDEIKRKEILSHRDFSSRDWRELQKFNREG